MQYKSIYGSCYINSVAWLSKTITPGYLAQAELSCYKSDRLSVHSMFHVYDKSILM